MRRRDEWREKAKNLVKVQGKSYRDVCAEDPDITLGSLHREMKRIGHARSREERRLLPRFLLRYDDPEERFLALVAGRIAGRQWSELALPYSDITARSLRASMKRACLFRGLEWPINQEKTNG